MLDFGKYESMRPFKIVEGFRIENNDNSTWKSEYGVAKEVFFS